MSVAMMFGCFIALLLVLYMLKKVCCSKNRKNLARRQSVDEMRILEEGLAEVVGHERRNKDPDRLKQPSVERVGNIRNSEVSGWASFSSRNSKVSYASKS